MSNLITPLALLSATLSAYSGGAIASLSQNSIPTLLLAPESLALTQWRQTYNLGKAFCPLIAGAGSLFALAATTLVRMDAGRMTGRAWVFAAAAVLPVMIAPLTVFVMDGVNGPLFEREERARRREEKGEGKGEGKEKEGGEGVSKETRELLERWRAWNAVRSLLPVMGAVAAGWGVWMGE